MSDYLTTGQVARALGISITALQQWAKDGVVQPAFTTPGGRMRWTVDGLLEQLGGRQQASLPPVALAVITSREGVAVGKRAEPPPPWSFIGGAEIEDGESATDTAVRAALEDARLKVTPTEHLGQRLHPATHRLVTYIACIPTSGNLAIAVGDEHRFTEVRWVEIAEASQLMPDMDPKVRTYLERTIGAS